MLSSNEKNIRKIFAFCVIFMLNLSFFNSVFIRFIINNIIISNVHFILMFEWFFFILHTVLISINFNVKKNKNIPFYPVVQPKIFYLSFVYM